MGLDVNTVKTKVMRINARNLLSKGTRAFVRLKNTWSSNSISRVRKLRLYKTLVLPVLLYESETWKMNKGDERARGRKRERSQQTEKSGEPL